MTTVKLTGKFTNPDILELWLNTSGAWFEENRSNYERRLLAENTEHIYLSVLNFAKNHHKTDDIYQEVK